MFTKARNKILMLNMVLVSAVMLAAFVLVYIAQYSRIQAENRSRLEAGESIQIFSGTTEAGLAQVAPTSPLAPTSGGAGGGGDAGIEPGVVSVQSSFISVSAGLYFTALADVEGNILALNSVLDIAPEVYDETVAAAVSQNSESGSVTAGGSVWQYLVTRLHFQVQGGSASTVQAEELLQIRFLDVTDSRNTLSTLMVTLIAVFLALLVAVFLISRYFANRAIRPMEQAWERQNRFVADASHELRTPLSVIGANCGVLLANREETVESQVKWIERINEGTGRMAGLVDSLLSLANAEDAQFEVVLADCDLSAVAVDALASAEAAALEGGVEVRADIEPGVHTSTDAERARQVMAILLDNAIKYSPKGGAVEVRLWADKKTVSWSVGNAGNGLAPGDLPKLFDRFYRGDPARSSANAGYGLGLSIAKAVAQQLGGNLGAGIREGIVTFTLVLERRTPAAKS